MAGCGGKKMKEGGMTKTQEAYAEGLRTGKGIPILRTMDKGLSKAVSTPKEKRMIEKGYEDMRKAQKYKKETEKKAGGGMLKSPDNSGLKKLPTDVRNKMGYMKKGGKVKPGYHKMPDGKIMKDSEHKKPMKKMAKGGMVKRDGCAVKGKTKGKLY